MFNKAVIALDLSPAEQPIVQCLPALRQWGINELILTHVMQIGYMQGVPLAHEKDYIDWLEEQAVPLREAGFSVAVQVRASGRPADEILAVASDVKADLLVIGSRGQNFINKLILGSVARQVIKEASLPVLLEWVEPVPEATQAHCAAVCQDTLEHILFATDFSGNAVAAENAALYLGSRAKRLDCLHVMTDKESGDTGSRQSLRTAMDEVTQRLRAGGANNVQGLLLSGRASIEITRRAKESNASLIIVGKHGQNPISSLVVGSTAENLCEHAGRPVLLVPLAH